MEDFHRPAQTDRAANVGGNRAASHCALGTCAAAGLKTRRRDIAASHWARVRPLDLKLEGIDERTYSAKLDKLQRKAERDRRWRIAGQSEKWRIAGQSERWRIAGQSE